ncbi:MAG: PaaI family thioesterase [Syntrophales bacterium]|jgi:acyl-CoA thioesterase|nr:PaaI family thioesterase [Syntrophales bacterium]
MSEKVFEALRGRAKDEPYAKMLGLELLKVDDGYALVRMTFTERHRNIYGRCHGGALFSLIDEAFQFASNSSGRIEIALNVSISYVKAPNEGDVLQAEAKLLNRSRRISHFLIEVRNLPGELMASCQATAYRRDDPLPFL